MGRNLTMEKQNIRYLIILQSIKEGLGKDDLCASLFLDTFLALTLLKSRLWKST